MAIKPIVWNAGLSVLLGAGSASANYRHANAQFEQDKANQAINNRNAQIAYTRSLAQIETAKTESAENAISASVSNQIESAQLTGAVTAEAGATGMGGTGIDMQVQDTTTTAARNHAKISLNKQREDDALNAEMVDSQSLLQSRIDLMPVQKPSKGSARISAVGSSMRNFTAMQGFGRVMKGW